jgi:nitrogen regulatory protein PII
MTKPKSNVLNLETKYYKLEALIKWKHVEEVNKMLIAGVSGHRVEEWCRQHGFEISHPKLYEYKGMLLDCISKNITVADKLGIGTGKKLTELIAAQPAVQATTQHVKNEMQVLDTIIEKGFSTLLNTAGGVNIKDAMKAIELKNKITGGSHNNLTGYGMEYIKELEQAKFEALVEVVKQYVAPAVYPELEKAIELAEENFYKVRAPELLEEYEKAKQAESNTDVEAPTDINMQEEA